MKFLSIVFLVGMLLTHVITNAQIKDNNQLVYHYGIVTGYELKNRQISIQKLPIEALIRGIKDYQSGSNQVSMATAEQAINNTMEEPTTNYLDVLGYAYGVLIGANWKTYEITATATTLTAFQEGVEAVFDGSKSVLSEEEGQIRVIQACKQFLAEKTVLQVKANQAFLNKNKMRPEVVELENGLQYEILKRTNGAKIGVTNQHLKVQYRGILRDGTVFEEAMDIPVIITRNSVIAGWKSILPLMRKNETFKVYLPPSLGYGSQARGVVPTHSILIYEITLLDVLD